MYDKYQIVIGLEIHAQLSTQSKIFAPDSTAFGASPNTQVSYITLAHPGTLPVINQKVIDYAVRMGLATHGQITKYNRFSRKNYFYPDLPKGYQITQFDTPISMGGYVTIKSEGKTRAIQLHHIHLEEDAGKSIHDQNDRYTLIDLNRAGTPLIEIVSEPDMHTPDEAYQFLTEIRKLVQFLGICNGNMEEGSMRCDANVSVRLKGETYLGQRTETKNMNSIRAVKRAIEYEAKRQIEVIESGGKIVQETRGFDPNTGTTFSQRGKEMAHDYRYFPEPDLPPVVLTDANIEQIKQQMPTLPEVLFAKYANELGLSEYDANLLTETRATAQYFDQTIQHTQHYKTAANWINGTIKSYLNEQAISISDFPIQPPQLAELLNLIQNNKVTHTAAVQHLFPAMLNANNNAIYHNVYELAQSLHIITQTDDTLTDQLIDDVLTKYPDKVKEYLYQGKKNVTGLFMGEIMRNSKGKLDAQIVNKRLVEKLIKLKK